MRNTKMDTNYNIRCDFCMSERKLCNYWIGVTTIFIYVYTHTNRIFLIPDTTIYTGKNWRNKVEIAKGTIKSSKTVLQTEASSSSVKDTADSCCIIGTAQPGMFKHLKSRKTTALNKMPSSVPAIDSACVSVSMG